MGDRSVRNLLFEEKSIVEQLTNTVHGAVGFAHNVQTTLDDIKDNTKRLFWWSSTFVVICVGLFLLGQLVRLHSQMSRMVQYQEIFRRMWEEDRILKHERLEEEKRERGQRRIAARRNKASAPIAPPRRYGRQDDEESHASGYRQSPFRAEVDDALDAVPPSGPQRDEWIRALADMTQESRRAHYQQQQEDDDEEEEIWGRRS
ncbi:uncharacterized protein GGS22DRAFT_191782 [Annulohypoxylon maeteangense]|uniref:uncharacterized protein n=1 Tax=Annulohypoxylon maeteangense TaxID=1927788 RepID=UPI0020084AA8|nr:uncharacterized protein GGS22DRAFT_191782 [Annulohypoxylon maeteangense]KAI0882051.1 hypothetical protein GGS22DRAFT_191782 [Annulohypoxylon maeteangense]